jgi:tRNA-specific 2-thiouridylase
MSGGVDSSVAAAELVGAGHEVVGATMKLWGGSSDSGCCSVADADDARRVAQQLGIAHHVFNFGAEFTEAVVTPYVRAHAAGTTPNPCVECNRRIKFDRLLGRARALGFDALATGHHARVVHDEGGWGLVRGRDRGKDQSYVLSMLGQPQLARCLFPVGEMHKAEVRARAAALRLRTADKADSQDVCFISSRAGRAGVSGAGRAGVSGAGRAGVSGAGRAGVSGAGRAGVSGAGRAGFLAERMTLHPGRLVDVGGQLVGAVPAVELVTVGQRRGMGAGPAGSRRYALSVDVVEATVVVGSEADLLSYGVALGSFAWIAQPLVPGAAVLAQTSAHGPAREAVFEGSSLRWAEPQRRVAPGQTVALYDGDRVLGSAVVE